MIETICGRGYVINWQAISAGGTIFSAIVALGIAYYAPLRARKFAKTDREADNKKLILRFIKELDSALQIARLNCSIDFKAVDPTPNSPERVRETGNLRDSGRKALTDARENIHLFDDVTGGLLNSLIGKLFVFERDCADLALNVENIKDATVVEEIILHLENEKGQMKSRIEAVGMALIKYGASAHFWRTVVQAQGTQMGEWAPYKKIPS